VDAKGKLRSNLIERLKGYVSLDGLRKLDIFRNSSELFQFEEFVVELIVEPDAEYFEEGTTYWNCTHSSGLYASVEEADEDAKASLPWLREGKYLLS